MTWHGLRQLWLSGGVFLVWLDIDQGSPIEVRMNNLNWGLAIDGLIKRTVLSGQLFSQLECKTVHFPLWTTPLFQHHFQWTDFQSAVLASARGSFHSDWVIYIRTKPDTHDCLYNLCTSFRVLFRTRQTHTHTQPVILGWPRASSGQQWPYLVILLPLSTSLFRIIIPHSICWHMISFSWVVWHFVQWSLTVLF